MGLKGGHQQKKERPHPFNQPSFPPPTQNNGLLPKNCRLRTALCWPWGCSPSTVEPMTLVGVTCSQEPLEQLSIQQELAKAAFGAEILHPAPGLCLALVSPLSPFSPAMPGQGRRRTVGAAGAQRFQGSPRANPAAPGEIKSPSAPSKGDAPSTSQLHLAPTRQLLTASAGCSSPRGVTEWLWKGRMQRAWKRAPSTEELPNLLLHMASPWLAPTGSRGV